MDDDIKTVKDFLDIITSVQGYKAKQAFDRIIEITKAMKNFIEHEIPQSAIKEGE